MTIKCEFSKSELKAMLSVLEQGKTEFGQLSDAEESAILKLKQALKKDR